MLFYTIQYAYNIHTIYNTSESRARRGIFIVLRSCNSLRSPPDALLYNTLTPPTRRFAPHFAPHFAHHSAERKLNDVENASRISAIQKTAFDSMASPSDIEEGTGGGKKRQVKTPRTDLFENDAKYWYRVANKTTLDPNNPEDIQALDEVARFARHALAIYTWMLYVYMDPLCGTCKLCNVRCCRMHSAKTYNGDACCSLHATALLAQANLDESEVRRGEERRHGA